MANRFRTGFGQVSDMVQTKCFLSVRPDVRKRTWRRTAGPRTFDTQSRGQGFTPYASLGSVHTASFGRGFSGALASADVAVFQSS